MLLSLDTQIKVMNLFEPEDQIRLFNCLESEDQVEVFKTVPNDQKISLLRLIKQDQRNKFFFFLEPEDQETLINLLPAMDQKFISDWANKTPKEQVARFKSMDADQQVYLYISLPAEEQQKLADHLKEEDHDILLVYNLPFSEKKIIGFQGLDSEEKNRLFEHLTWEEQIKLFNYLDASSFKDSFLTTLSPIKQTELFKHLDTEEQERFIETLPSDSQDLIWEWSSVSGKDQKRFFDSLDKEKQRSLLHIIKQLHEKEKELLISLFFKLDENGRILLFQTLQKKESKLSILLFQKLHSHDKTLLFTQLSNKERVSFFKGLTWEEKDKLFKYLDLDAQAEFFAERQKNTLAISKPLTMVDKAEESVGHLYKYRARFLQVLTFILGIGAMILCLNYTLKFIKSSKSPEPIFTKIEGIKKLGEMHLVKQKYESVIPITDKKLTRKGKLKGEKIEFLLIAPIEVTGYIDFGNLEVAVKKDSLLEIVLPEAHVSEAYLDFSKTEEYLAEGKFRIFGKYLERINHKQAYYDIAGGINAAKERVRLTAEKKHFILRETQNKAQIFLRNFGNTLGYRVDFVSAEEAASDPTTSEVVEPATGEEKKDSFIESAIKKIKP